MELICLIRSAGLAITPRFLRDLLFWGLVFAGALLMAGAGWLLPALFPDRAASGWPLIGLALWQPVLEEILFRGALQGAFLDTRFGGTRLVGELTLANAIQAVLFAAAHLAWHPPAWALAVIVPGAAFGWLRDRHGHIGGALLAHVTWNVLYFGLVPGLLASGS
jgi:membrane protease YdiL (CAAX protease family)